MCTTARSTRHLDHPRALAVQTAKANSNVGAIKYDNYRIERLNGKVEGDYHIRSTLYPQ